MGSGGHEPISRRSSRHRIHDNVAWNVHSCTRKFPCSAYGLLDFQGTGFINQAQYCRMSFDQNPVLVAHLLLKVWNLPPPNLAISVHGGVHDFEIQSKLKFVLKSGLVKAAETTGAWMITSGLNCGVSKEVGSAVKGALRRNHRIPCIGVTPWGIVEGREHLSVPNGTIRYYSRRAAVSKLNAYHTHFLLADDGTSGKHGAEITLRRKLERYIASSRFSADCGIARGAGASGSGSPSSRARIPLVCVIVEGGPNMVRVVLDYVTDDPPVPVVVCDGTGRAADIIAFVHNHYDESIDGLPDQLRDQVLVIMETVFSLDQENTKKLYNELLMCMKQGYDYISIFQYSSQVEYGSQIDVKILSALLRVHWGSSGLDPLKMTMAWGRPDLAQNQIFRHGQVWKSEEYNEAMMMALSEDRIEFVKLLMNNGVEMQRFLTFKSLEDLYNTTKGPANMLSTLMKEVKLLFNEDQKLKLTDIGKIIESLIGGAYRSCYCRRSFKNLYNTYWNQRKASPVIESNSATLNSIRGNSIRRKLSGVVWNGALAASAEASLLRESSGGKESPENGRGGGGGGGGGESSSPNIEVRFENPFHDLFVWAVLTHRQEMAKFLWQQGTEPLSKAIFGANVYFAMASEAEKCDLDLDSAEQLRNYGEEFVKLGLFLLEECYKTDDKLTAQLLTYELRQWSKHTCLSLAVNAGAKAFVAHNACQLLINDLWLGGLQINKSSSIKVITCVLIPPLLFTLDYKSEEELKLMPQTAEEHIAELGSDGEAGGPSDYDSDSSSSSSSSSASSNPETQNDFNSQLHPSVAGEERNAIKKRLRKLSSRRRRGSRMSSIVPPVPVPAPAPAPPPPKEIAVQFIPNDPSKSETVQKVFVHSGGDLTGVGARSLPRDVKEGLLLQEQAVTGTGQGQDDMTNGEPLETLQTSNNVNRMSDANNFNVLGSRRRLRHEIIWTKKFYEFYNAPITKFWSHTLAFFVFLGMFHWMVLVALPQVPHWTELYVIACVLSMTLEVCREVILSEPVKISQKVKVWFNDPWNIIDFLGCSTFLVAMGLRFVPLTMSWGRWLYCLNLILWYAKLLEVFSVNKSLGPFVQIIAQMMLDMISFLVFMFLVLMCYGTVRQAILHPNEPFSWTNVRDIFFHPYFMIYGEVYASEIAREWLIQAGTHSATPFLAECGTGDTEPCVTGGWIEPALMAVYLLVENILLVNLLIALFNNTYNQVRSMTRQVWKYQRYYVIMHHETKSVVPPPLTFLSYFYLLFRCISKRQIRRLHGYDKGLKLFLSAEDEKRVNQFESQCLACYLRNQETSTRNSQEERLRLIDERTDTAGTNYTDLREKMNVSRFTLQNLEMKTSKIEESVKHMSLAIESLYNLVHELMSSGAGVEHAAAVAAQGRVTGLQGNSSGSPGSTNNVHFTLGCNEDNIKDMLPSDESLPSLLKKRSGANMNSSFNRVPPLLKLGHGSSTGGGGGQTPGVLSLSPRGATSNPHGSGLSQTWHAGRQESLRKRVRQASHTSRCSNEKKSGADMSSGVHFGFMNSLHKKDLLGEMQYSKQQMYKHAHAREYSAVTDFIDLSCLYDRSNASSMESLYENEADNFLAMEESRKAEACKLKAIGEFLSEKWSTSASNLNPPTGKSGSTPTPDGTNLEKSSDPPLSALKGDMGNRLVLSADDLNTTRTSFSSYRESENDENPSDNELAGELKHPGDLRDVSGRELRIAIETPNGGLLETKQNSKVSISPRAIAVSPTVISKQSIENLFSWDQQMTSDEGEGEGEESPDLDELYINAHLKRDPSPESPANVNLNQTVATSSC